MRTGAAFRHRASDQHSPWRGTEAIEKFGHDRLPTFGVGKEYGKQEWRSIFRQLHGAGIIALDITGYGTWSVTEAGRRVLKGADKVTLRKDTLKPATRKAARAAANAAALADGAAGDAALFEALRQRRSELAKEQRVAAYVVFADKTLIDMARRKPATAAEMSAVHGVGEAKLRQYGDIFLDVIRQHGTAAPNRANGLARPFCRFPLLHRIPRYVSKAAIFAGRAGHFPRAPNFQVPLKSQGLAADRFAGCGFAESCKELPRRRREQESTTWQAKNPLCPAWPAATRPRCSNSRARPTRSTR